MRMLWGFCVLCYIVWIAGAGGFAAAFILGYIL